MLTKEMPKLMRPWPVTVIFNKLLEVVKFRAKVHQVKALDQELLC